PLFWESIPNLVSITRYLSEIWDTIPQIVKHLSRKAFFRHALTDSIPDYWKNSHTLHGLLTAFVPLPASVLFSYGTVTCSAIRNRCPTNWLSEFSACRFCFDIFQNSIDTKRLQAYDSI
ncbi:MAG: hypothetical protein K2P69_01390, partial [Eubacterium sp.]|nr:hypothetical protein [Eubacterium sp.]